MRGKKKINDDMYELFFLLILDFCRTQVMLVVI